MTANNEAKESLQGSSDSLRKFEFVNKSGRFATYQTTANTVTMASDSLLYVVFITQAIKKSQIREKHAGND